MSKWCGCEAAFVRFGIGQGSSVFDLAWLLRGPDPGAVPSGQAARARGAGDYRPLEMVRTPVFWVMHLMFVMVAAGGLMATAQLAPIARDFRIADTPVSLLGLTLPALTFAMSIDRVLNGITRPFWG